MTLTSVSLPVRSVTWIKVSFQVAKIWQTPKTNSPEAIFCGPKFATIAPCLVYAYPAPPYISYAVGCCLPFLVGAFFGCSYA